MNPKTLILMALISVPVASAEFDIEKHCKEVSQFAGGSYQIEQGCRNNERKAKDQLSAETIPAEIERHCAEVAEFAGGSYQIMKGCVANESKAKANLR